MRVVTALCLLPIAGASLLCPAAPGGEAWFSGVGDLPGYLYGSWAYGVSGDGRTVVGKSWSYKSHNLSYEAFWWRRDLGIHGLDDLRDIVFVWSEANAASYDGSVVAGMAQSERGYEATRWSLTGGAAGLGNFNDGARTVYSWALGVSADGNVIVGFAERKERFNSPFRWTPQEGMQKLPHLPGGERASAAASAVSADGSVVVGSGISQKHRRGEAIRWVNGEPMGLGTLPGGTRSTALAVSADGRAVVGGSDGDPNGGAFLWTADKGMLSLGSIPQERPGSAAYGVSADGSVVVGTAGAYSEYGIQAFIWDGVHGMRSLRRVLEEEYDLDLRGWYLIHARAISYDGLTIVGEGIGPNGEEGWVAHIPEPGAIWLLVLTAPAVPRRREAVSDLRVRQAPERAAPVST